MTIPKEKQNKQLANVIIDSELPGIFNWALAGLSRLLDQKNFTQSSKSDEVLNLYKYENDSLKNFIDEKGCTKSYDKKIKLGDFYKLYKEYCIDQGFDPESRRGFGTKMKSLGYKVARGKSVMHLFIE